MTLAERIGTAVFEIRDCYDRGMFQQLRLLTLKQFVSQTRERGLSFWQQDLDQFEELIPAIDTVDEKTSLYHPYQVWVVDRLAELLEPNLAWVSYMKGSREALDAAIDRHWEHVTVGMDQLRERCANFYELLAILSRAEPRFLPDIRRRLSLPASIGDENAREEYITWRQDFEPSAALTDFNCRLEEIRTWHRQLSTRAVGLDDAEHWYLLMRHANFDSRRRLKGRLKLAYDYYEMAEILRMLLWQASGEVLPAEDEYFGGGHKEWKSRAYGVEDIDFAERLVLKRILRDFDLDAAYRAFWFVEGDTEVGFFVEFSNASGLDLEQRGVALVNLGGGGDIAQRRKETAQRLRGARQFVEVLNRLKADEVFTFVTADDDDGIEEGLESLRRQGLLTAGFVKWRGDFEEGNFKTDELIHVIHQLASLQANDEALVTTAEVEKERQRIDNSGRIKSLGKAVEDVARRKPGLEQFGKSEEWGKSLAKYALEHPQLNGSLRPAVQAWHRALRMTYSDFKGTLDRFELDATGDMTPRRNTPSP